MSHRANSTLALVLASISVGAQAKQPTTYHVEIGRGDEVIAQADLHVAGTEVSSFSRSWPVEGEPYCSPHEGERRYAAFSKRISVRLMPLPKEAGTRGKVRLMEVRGEWGSYLGMPGGVESGDCDAFPSSNVSSNVTRIVSMDLAETLMLHGDEGLFVRIGKR